MAKNLVVQPSANPSRKVTAMTLAIAGWECAWIIWSNIMPSYASVELKAGLTPVIGLAVGWFVKDEANIVVQQDVVATDVLVTEPEAS